LESSFEEVAKHISRKQIAETAFELVKVPSPTGQELRASELYAEILRNAGLEVALQFVQKERPNVIGRFRGPEQQRGLMFCGHIDTIPWEHCVSPKIENGRVYGRGSCDMKGGLAAIAAAAKAVLASGSRLRANLFVCAYFGHEAPAGRGEGPIALAKAISEGKIGATAAVVAEGPLDSIGIAHGGLAIFKVRIEGPEDSFHTATVPLRSNPIIWLGKVIEEVECVDAELNLKDWNRLIPQRPSIQLSIVSGGDFYNRLPISCELLGTVRWDPGETVSDVTERLKERLRRVEHRLWNKYDSRVRLSLEVDLVREGCEIPENEDFVQQAVKAASFATGRRYEVSGWRQAYDLSIFYRIAGIPTIGFGSVLPSDSTSHSNNESVSIENLETMARVYAALALEYCK
jgi:acetylornithine deacetylase/succinyl-diaminopimelate desuccinylase-like protein